MKIFAVDIDLQTVPITVIQIGNIKNDIERGKRMNFRTADVTKIPEPSDLFQFVPPNNGRSLVCLAVHHDGVPPGHDAIVVYQLHR